MHTALEVGYHAAIAMSTDYDCWKDDEDQSLGGSTEDFQENASNVTDLLLYDPLG